MEALRDPKLGEERDALAELTEPDREWGQYGLAGGGVAEVIMDYFRMKVSSY